MLFLLSDGSDMAMPGCGMTGMSMFSESSFFLNLLFFRAGRPSSPWELCGRGSAVHGASLTNQNALIPQGLFSVRRLDGEHKLSIALAIAPNSAAERYAGGIAGPGAASPACA